jgi:hypothetical protein
MVGGGGGGVREVVMGKRGEEERWKWESGGNQIRRGEDRD